MDDSADPPQFRLKKLPSHKKGSIPMFTGFYDPRNAGDPVPDVVAICTPTKLPGEKHASRQEEKILIPRDATVCFEYPVNGRKDVSEFFCD